jgi:hypothetical protein
LTDTQKAPRRASREIWHPPEYDQADIRAVQALVVYAKAAEIPPEPGEEVPIPSPAEVKRALDWIIHKAAATYDEPFRPGQPDVRDYMLGRRSVGLAIVKMATLKPAIFDGRKD